MSALRTTSTQYGAIPPYEVAIIYTLRPMEVKHGLQYVRVHTLGPYTGTLHEWHKR